MKARKLNNVSFRPPFLFSALFPLLVNVISFIIFLSNLSAQELTALASGWKVVHHQLLSPTSFPEHAPSYQLPENTQPNEFGVYEHPAISTLKLVLDHAEPSQNLGLIIPDIFSSYRLFCNGVLIGEMGYPSTSPHTYKAYVKPAVYFFNSNNRTEILLQVANFHVAGDKIRSVPLLGKATDVMNYIIIQWGLEAFLIFLLLSVALVLMVIPEINNKISSRLFAMFLIFLALRFGFTGSKLFLFILPNLGFETVSDLGYILASLGAIFFVMSLAFRYQVVVDWSLVGFLVGLNTLGMLSVLIFTTSEFPPYAVFFDMGLVLSVVWVFLLPLGLLLKGQPLRPLFWFSLSFVPISAFFDLLIYGSALRLNSLLPLGLFFFALGQTIYIALENSKHEKEELQILMELSETLDKRQNFLDQFQHHIRTPIQGMLSYVESYRADPSESQKLESLSQVLLKLTSDTEFALKGKK